MLKPAQDRVGQEGVLGQAFTARNGCKTVGSKGLAEEAYTAILLSYGRAGNARRLERTTRGSRVQLTLVADEAKHFMSLEFLASIEEG
jgi:hypothetical protein